MSIPDAKALLNTAPVGRLGLSNHDRPYVVPVNFVYMNDAIFVHSAPYGKKLRILQANPTCCMEVDEMLGFICCDTPCQCGVYYRSVIASCTAKWVTDTEEKHKALTAFTEKYACDGTEPCFTDDRLDAVIVVKFNIDERSGKKHVPSQR